MAKKLPFLKIVIKKLKMNELRTDARRHSHIMSRMLERELRN